ncbi:MAG: hypothetical protein ABSB18_00825 [Candidatus Omnitrophota bacterium]
MLNTNMLLQLTAYFYPLYFLGLLLFFISVFFKSYRTFRGLLINISSKDIVVLLVLLLAGFIFRLKYTAHIDLDPYGWGYIKDALRIKSYFLYPGLYSGLLGTGHIPGYPFFIFFPLTLLENISVVSGFNICFSVLTIPVIYLITYLVTEDKDASFLAALALALSALHTFYSGYEIPMSISVFFVTLEFLYFVAWLKTRNMTIWLTFISLFLISVNIKIENSFLFPLFAIIGAKELLKDNQRKLFHYSLIFIPLLLISMLFWLPFVGNMVSSFPRYFAFIPDLVGFRAFLSNILLFFIYRLKGYPLFMLLALVILKLMKKSFRMDYLILGWFFLSLLVYFLGVEVDAIWHTMQILVPVFIISAYVISQAISIFFKGRAVRYILLVLLCFFYFLGYERQMSENKPYSWEKLIQELKTDSEKSCIITHDFLITKFNLPFLFPRKTWLFLSDDNLKVKMRACEGKVYYFNPLPYGLEEEMLMRGAKEEQFAVLKNEIQNKYNLIKISDSEFFELEKK